MSGSRSTIAIIAHPQDGFWNALRLAVEATFEPVPDEIRAIRAGLGFDYGKFDYGIVDEEVVLYDVNPTPGASPDARLHVETVRELAPGIFDFLP
ncbi:MAG TPA: hypothetical protein VFH82_13915 [Gemmatimonadota bacterium]|nr:hypothetical protein [Gemmatimonadota bacterium]